MTYSQQIARASKFIKNVHLAIRNDSLLANDDELQQIFTKLTDARVDLSMAITRLEHKQKELTKK